ncbi:MAG TPA: hypothetical protein VGN72_03505 [Tepidisphaeraceae bacterium]|jgi:hypothetical protein|nr:hypothetical protein [Tepidisphaeraceae bacterium]
MSYLDPTDPRNMTVEDRLAEIAAILARRVLRLHRRHALGRDSHSDPGPSFRSGSDLMCRPTHGHHP